MKKCLFLSVCCCLIQSGAFSQDSAELWHNKKRSLRYKPEGSDFVIKNGDRRFTRALYGTNTAFRVEAGDLPEFALYLPGMGGNIKFGIQQGDSSKWLINAASITSRYRPGSMLYEIEDPILGSGSLSIVILAMADAEGAIIQIQAKNIPANISLVWAYGGVTGRKFSRDGDMGPDPESVFYMQPDYCRNNQYSLGDHHFFLKHAGNKNISIHGILPTTATVKIVNARNQESPLHLLNSVTDSTPVVAGEMPLDNKGPVYFSFSKSDSNIIPSNLAVAFEMAEVARRKIAERIKVVTPDPYINTIGAAISIAADAIWEAPSFMHGAIGWRMRLNGWRGAYAADVLGWHDRARQHFRAYAQSQLTSPDSGKIIADTALHLARHIEKLGTAVFSSGYISRNPNGDFRPHHYDMNLVFIDQLLWHFNWTGDTAFVKEMWPVIKRHLAWEKRNFDVDGDGLYDAYAAIWASDALQYSGGAVTHSSAYNYRANKLAAMLADLINENGDIYKKEADKILNAINNVLWMKDNGVYAEFKDALGLQQLHPYPALWTIYHSLDSDVADAFQAYQNIQYIQTQIPHIPIIGDGVPGGLYTVSTSNWMPYTWSLNNVALAELMHTTLSFWQSNKNEDAFVLWKSSLMESMFMGGSPGNFQQISTYDAARGEAYRDFADPVGMTSRSLIQGLFGILPDALNNKVVIKPGFPDAWNHASLQTPDIDFSFKRSGKKDEYKISMMGPNTNAIELILKAKGNNIRSITINNKKVNWINIEDAIDVPMIKVSSGIDLAYTIVIEWSGTIDTKSLRSVFVANKDFEYFHPITTLKKVYDPQQLFSRSSISSNKLTATLNNKIGFKTAFVKVQEGAFSYWKAINLEIKNPIELLYDIQQKRNSVAFRVKNNQTKTLSAQVFINRLRIPITIKPNAESVLIEAGERFVVAGSNTIVIKWANDSIKKNIINWNVHSTQYGTLETIDLGKIFNDKVSNIFKNHYLSPRPKVPTLQLPTQGIGDWTHPLLTPVINDSGFRVASKNDLFSLPQNIVFKSPQDTNKANIIFTSQWDNYPDKLTIPLTGKANHAYFLMAGSTNPMQSQLVNGKIRVTYTDGSSDSLLLRNPNNWWPIEQDYLNDGHAFNTKAERPIRVHLKTGKIFSLLNDPRNEYNGKMIDGGAATVLDLPLNKNKTLATLRLETNANDVVIGLMALTLRR